MNRKKKIDGTGTANLGKWQSQRCRPQKLQKFAPPTRLISIANDNTLGCGTSEVLTLQDPEAPPELPRYLQREAERDKLLCFSFFGHSYLHY